MKPKTPRQEIINMMRMNDAADKLMTELAKSQDVLTSGGKITYWSKLKTAWRYLKLQRMLKHMAN